MIEKGNPDSLSSLLDNYHKQKKIDLAADWEQLRKRILFERNKHVFFNFLRNTAAILFPLFLLYQFVLNPVLNTNNSIQEMITVASAPGMITKIILPDGSEAWLNSLSSLTYPPHFQKKERTVQLSGEAYFKVVSNKKYRFNVVTPEKMIVSAYGTEFNVNAYERDSEYEVTLASGHVDVSSEIGSKEIKTLAADEKAILNTLTGNIDVVMADTYAETAWRTGKMVFRREKLGKIAENLSRKFKANIIFENESLKEYEFTATFSTETLEEILDLLKQSTPITYSICKPEKRDTEAYTQKKITIRIL